MPSESRTRKSKNHFVTYSRSAGYTESLRTAGCFRRTSSRRSRRSVRDSGLCFGCPDADPEIRTAGQGNPVRNGARIAPQPDGRRCIAGNPARPRGLRGQSEGPSRCSLGFYGRARRTTAAPRRHVPSSAPGAAITRGSGPGARRPTIRKRCLNRSTGPGPNRRRRTEHAECR
jgi:hypothetical protein